MSCSYDFVGGFESLVSRHTTLGIIVVILTISIVCLAVLYRLALPKPFLGIPYNAPSARNILGDVPAMLKHISHEGGTFISYLTSTLERLDAPMVQVFIGPFRRPLLILADFREAQHIMTRRADEFDRSTSSGDLVRGLAPQHHIHLKTTPVWRAQRRLLQDLMTPSFLHHVAGPAIYKNAMALVDLWAAKEAVADGRAWAASGDIDHVSLDAVMAFTFGEKFGNSHSATAPALEAIRAMDSIDFGVLQAFGGPEGPAKFPVSEADEVINSTLELVDTVQDVQGSPFPDLSWKWVNMKPRIRRATKIKQQYITDELRDAIGRLDGSGEESVKSAVDYMVYREKALAEKEGRQPDYFSRIMLDEIFGFIVAGNDTSSTAIAWGLKYLADTAEAQTRLRSALQASFSASRAEGRTPSIQDITSSHIPILDAVIEETLRCAASVPVVDREAVVDTELLGHRIPKGTVVTCLVTGPSMTSPPFRIEEGSRGGCSAAAAAADDKTKTQSAGRGVMGWDVGDMAHFRPERWLVAAPGGQEVFDGTADSRCWKYASFLF
ncbi:hypothetical protein SLS63_008701 [Diaporthe eres]|uniref:Cytochrome P450 n=1 Tax=Diaporthe eres TaxID=83184 RepID=A0ABR1P1U9_DIAER